MKHCTGMRRGPIYSDYPQPIPVDTVISNGALKIAIYAILFWVVVGLLIVLL